jgi:maltose/maltodextrin transport system substrate-binding protein
MSWKMFILVIVLICPLVGFANEAPKKLTIWTSNENVRDAVKSVSAKFEKDFGVQVDVVVLNKDVKTQFQTAAMSGKGPDILSWAHDVTGELAASGLIEPIKVSKELKTAYFPVALEAFTYQGKVYGYPYDMEAVALFYNKKLITSPPKTMEELISWSKDFAKKEPKKHAFLYDLSNLFFSYSFLSAGGGYVFKMNSKGFDPTNIGLANKGAIEGAELILRFVVEGVIPETTDRSVAINKMKKNELAMTIDGPWTVKELLKSGVDFGVAPIPLYKGNRPKPFVGVHGFFIRRSSDKKDLAKALIENYLVTKQGIIDLYKMDPRGPARKDAMGDLKEEKYLPAFMESIQAGHPMPNVPQMASVWGSVGASLGLIVTKKKAPKEALEAAVKQIQQNVTQK